MMILRVCFVGLLLASAACESKPVRSQASSSKLTPNAKPRQIELYLTIKTEPRPMSPTLVSSQAVMECLRQSTTPEDKQFAAQFSGRLTETGSVERIDASPTCLRAALMSLRLGNGAAGPFAGEITAIPPADLKPLSFILSFEPRYRP